MNMAELLAYINALQQDLEKNIEKLKDDYLKNMDAPIDERWDAFAKISHLLPCESYGDGHIKLLDPNGSVYDDFYVHRHETMRFVDMFDRMDEVEKPYSTESIYAWKEVVLASGYGSFTYDW